MTDHTDIVERLRMERRATAWRRGLDCDFPTAFEQHSLCEEAAAEITRLRAEAEALRNTCSRVAADAMFHELATSVRYAVIDTTTKERDATKGTT